MMGVGRVEASSAVTDLAAQSATALRLIVRDAPLKVDV